MSSQLSITVVSIFSFSSHESKFAVHCFQKFSIKVVHNLLSNHQTDKQCERLRKKTTKYLRHPNFKRENIHSTYTNDNKIKGTFNSKFSACVRRMIQTGFYTAIASECVLAPVNHKADTLIFREDLCAPASKQISPMMTTC